MINNKVKEQSWRLHPLQGCICSDGKDYSVSFKEGSINKLLVNFAGGGLSWKEETAAKPITIGALLRKQEAFYINSVSPTMIKLMHVGILDTDNTRNPFHNWYVLNIPYATADFHIGCSAYPYRNIKGENKILYHHGIKNVEAALDLLKDFFRETPEILVISGQSAGAFGCVAHCPKIKNLYPDCDNIVVYSEGSHLYSPLWQEITRNVWKVNSELISYIKGNDLILDLFRYARDNMPLHTTFLHSNSVWDKTLTEFMYKMNHGKLSANPQALQEFHDTLINAVRELKKEIPSYSYYLTDYGKNSKTGTTPHIFAGSPKLLYSDMQDNMSIASWISKAIEKKPMDIGEQFILKNL